MSKKDLFRSAVAEGLELPEDIVEGLPRLILTGNAKVVLENHGGIVHYDSNSLVINYGDKQLEIGGKNMVLPLLRKDIITVEGEVASIILVSSGE